MASCISTQWLDAGSRQSLTYKDTIPLRPAACSGPWFESGSSSDSGVPVTCATAPPSFVLSDNFASLASTLRDANLTLGGWDIKGSQYKIGVVAKKVWGYVVKVWINEPF